MVGEEMISAISGHDIKYKASQKLNDEVEKWLKKGNEIKGIEKTVFDVQKKESKGVLLGLIKEKEERIKIQQPFLINYRQTVGIHAFGKLVKATNRLCTPSHLNGTMKGECSINPLKWVTIKKEAEKILIEFEASKFK